MACAGSGGGRGAIPLAEFHDTTHAPAPAAAHRKDSSFDFIGVRGSLFFWCLGDGFSMRIAADSGLLGRLIWPLRAPLLLHAPGAARNARRGQPDALAWPLMQDQLASMKKK